MSKIRKSLIVGVVLIMCVGILCACNNGDDFRNPINGEPKAGEFYTLQEAFDNGWLSRYQLKSIAYHHAQVHSDPKLYGNFKPIAINPQNLPKNIENRIKQNYLTAFLNEVPSASIEGIEISSYYGIYDNCIIVEMIDKYYVSDLQIDEKIEIGGVAFYNYGHTVRVCAK